MLKSLLRAAGDWWMAFLWTVLLSSCVMFRSVFSLLWLIGATLLIAWVYVLRRSGRPARRWATLRLRPLGASAKWIFLAIVPVVAFQFSLNHLYTTAIGHPAEAEPKHLLAALTGFKVVSIFAFATIAGPIVEEGLFRGWMQSRLQRRWGPHIAVLLTAVLFAAMHPTPLLIPVYISAGVIFGYAVAITRSLWAGIILHVAGNGVISVGELIVGAAMNDHTELPEFSMTIPLLICVLSGTTVVFTLLAARRAQRSNAGCRRRAIAGDPNASRSVVTLITHR